VNVRAPYFLVQQLLPIMGNGSSVVLLSSLAAHASVARCPPYAATKGAIDTLVKHFASALANVAFASMPLRLVWYDRHVELRQDRSGRDFTLGIQALSGWLVQTTSAAAITFSRPMKPAG